MDISEPDETCSCHKVIKSEPIPQPELEWYPSISSLNSPIYRFGSMNIDELFNNVWTEENQASLNLNHNIEPTNGENGDTQPEILPRQDSFKTMEEIFPEINTYEPQLPSINLNSSTTQDATFSEESLEEMTLEDFLVKARVLRKSSKSSPQKIMLENFQNQGGNSSSNNIQGDQLLSNVASNCGGSNWIGDGRGTIEGNLCDNIGEGNWNNSESSDVTEPSNKRRKRTNPVEVVVERRQRRMIKNRESAARCRARKQAYTMKLEIEKRQLKEEHRRLKLELELLKKEAGKAKKMEGKLAKPMRRTLSV